MLMLKQNENENWRLNKSTGTVVV